MPARPGVQIFISHYVEEWTRWHRSGCSNLSVCDVAAFKVAALHCYYFDVSPWSETLVWLHATLGVPLDIDILNFSPDTLPDSALEAFALLRPSIAQSPKPSALEIRRDLAISSVLLDLAHPLEHFLVLGSDNRLTLDPRTLLNGYGCRPFPRPEAITFSSSTASSISKYAFDLTEQRRQEAIVDALKKGACDSATKLANEVRSDLLTIFKISHLAQVALSSSGTDGFMLVQGLLRLLADEKLVCLMVGADESGTGVPLAAQERHFAIKSALGKPVVKGQSLDVAKGDETFINIPMRDASHRALPPGRLDQNVRELVEKHLAAGAHVVIHAMNHSKLGLTGPSTPCLIELKQRHGDRLHVTIDACQLRLDADEIREYLKQGFPIIITGSKFFTGPPLSGAVLIPRPIVTRILGMNHHLPESFSLYCAACDLPLDLQPLLVNPQSYFNFGSYFRWVAAIAEMKRYFLVPAPSRKKALNHFSRKIEPLLSSRPFIEAALQPSPIGEVAPKGELSGRRMIFPFFLIQDQDPDRRVCTEDEVLTIYTLLNQDCAENFTTANAREYRLLSQKCHVGQPVKALHPSGQSTAVLRINMGARIVSESWSERDRRIEPRLIEDELWQVGVVLDKIELLLEKAL